MKSILKKKIFLLPFVLIFLINFVYAVTISTDDFECNGFNCGSGWSGAWAYSGDCIVTGLGTPIGAYHMRGQEDASGTCIADRNFDNSGYTLSNISFWAKSEVLEAGDYCRYYYNNGSNYFLLLEMTDGQDDGIYKEYNYSVNNYGKSSNAGIRMRQFGVGSDNCYIDSITTTGFSAGASDITPPNVSLKSPANGTTLNVSTVYFKADFSDDVNVTNATLYIWNSTNALIGTNFTKLGNASISANLSFNLSYAGTFYWNYLAFDNSSNSAMNNSNFTLIFLPPDVILPSIKIIYPLNTSYNVNVTQLNYTVSDINLQSCWYSLNNGETNTTITCGQNATGLTSVEGSNSWSVWANDSAGNTNKSSVTFFKDATPLIVTINQPQNITYNSFPISFNVTLNEDGNFCNFTLDNGINNYTMQNNGNRDFNATNTSIADGSYLARYYCWDTLGNFNGTATRSFSVDRTVPLISIVYPLNISYNINVSQLNYTIIEASPDKCWYSNSSGLWNSTTTTAGINFTNVISIEGSNSWIVYCNDSVGNLNYSAITFFKDTIAPNINFVFPTENSGIAKNKNYIEVNVTAVDSGSELDKIIIRIYNSSGYLNYTNNSATSPFYVNVSGLIDGLYFYNVTVNDTAGNTNSTETRNITLDTTYPSFSNYWDNNATLVGSGIALFNVTVANTNGTVFLEINGNNYTATNSTSDVYNVSVYLANGTYSYYWSSWGNGAIHNYNISTIRSYTVNNTDTIYPLFSNLNASPESPATYSPPTAVYYFNATIDNTNGTAGFEFNGVNYTSTNLSNVFNVSINNLAAGSYNYYWWSYGNGYQHLYNTTTIQTYTINKTTPAGSISGGGTWEYPHQTTVQGTETNNGDADVVYNLSRNGIIVNNSDTQTLGVGEWNYIYNSTEGQNYTLNVSIATALVNITQNNTYVLTLTGTSPITYGAAGDVTGSGCPSQLTCQLFRNDTVESIGNPDTTILAAGKYNYTYNTTGNANYSSQTKTFTLSVNQDNGAGTLLLNGTAGNLLMVYNGKVNASFTNLTDTGTLFRNGIDITSLNNVYEDLSAGYYNFTLNIAENQNYSAFSISRFVNVTKANSLVYTFLNNSRDNITITQGTSVYLNGSLISGEGIIKLYLNNELINSGNGNISNLTQFNTVGLFNVTTIYEQTENYSSSSESWFVNVTLLADSVAPNVTNLIPVAGSTFNVSDVIEITTNVVDDVAVDSVFVNITLPNTTIIKLNLNNVEGNKYNNSYLIPSLEGRYNLTVFANDTTGNINDSENSYFVANAQDTTAPLVSIVYPQNQSYNTNVSKLNYTVSDNVALSSCWYSLNDGATNTTLTCGNNLTGLTSIEGSNSWSVWANDTTGNLNSTSVSFSINTSTANNLPYVVLNEPTNGTILSVNYTLLNASVFDINNDNLTVWFYGNNILLNTINNATNGTNLIFNWTNLNNGLYNWTVIANDGKGNSSLDFRYFVVNVSLQNTTQNGTVPVVNISYPSYASTYYDNNTIALNFSVSGENIEKCWYSLTNGASNVSISNCANTTFGVASDGEYNLTVFANESIQGLIGNDSLKFFVKNGKPTVHLISPENNKYINYSNVIFVYIPFSQDVLDSCELWATFNGSYSINQSKNAINSGQENNFLVRGVTEGNYLWAIRCNTTTGSDSITGNRTLISDFTPPVISINQLNSEYSSDSNVTINFSVFEANPHVCMYNLTYFSGALVLFKVLQGCENAVISIRLQPDTYSLYLQSDDAAGNRNSITRSFVVVSSDSGNTVWGGGGGDGANIVIAPTNKEPQLKINNPGKIFLERGTSQNFGLEVVNTGGKFLNNCHLIFSDGATSWLKNEQTKGIGVGEKFNFDLKLEVPADAEPGEYPSDVNVKCDEVEKSEKLNIEVYRNVYEAEIIDYERVRTKLRVKYALREYGGENHDMNIRYFLLDISGLLRYSGQETLSLKAKESSEKVLEFELPKDSFGEFKFKMDFDDGKTKISATKDIFLPSNTSLTGLAISDANRKALGWLIAAITTLSLFVASRIIKKKYLRVRYSKGFHKTLKEIHTNQGVILAH